MNTYTHVHLDLPDVNIFPYLLLFQCLKITDIIGGGQSPGGLASSDPCFSVFTPCVVPLHCMSPVDVAGLV